GMKRVEGLLQTFFREFAGIDGTADPGRRGDQALSHLAGFRVPKKSGPDQRVPVISRAIFERLRYCLPRYPKPASLTLTSWTSPPQCRISRVPERMLGAILGCARFSGPMDWAISRSRLRAPCD